MTGDARPAVGDSYLMLGDAFGNPVNLPITGVLTSTESKTGIFGILESTLKRLFEWVTADRAWDSTRLRSISKRAASTRMQ